MTLTGNGEVTKWKDSSPQGNDFINDGTVGDKSPRTKPKYVASNPALNFQPSVQFIRSGNGSLLLDKDGLFAQNEQVAQASAYVVAGGISLSNQTSQIFYENLQGTGKFGAYIPFFRVPHKSYGIQVLLHLVIHVSRRVIKCRLFRTTVGASSMNRVHPFLLTCIKLLH